MRLKALSLALALTLTACGDREPAPVTPNRGGTAVVAIRSDIKNPLPLYIATITDGSLSDVLYHSLLRTEWDGERIMRRTSETNPMAIARSYHYIGNDSSALHFKLRSDIRWSDSVPLTAHDVAWTYRMVAHPDAQATVAGAAEQLDSVVAHTDTTVTFFFKRRYPEMLGDASLPIMPAHAYRDVPPSELARAGTSQRNTPLVTSGPFRLARWQPDAQIVLERNPTFAPTALLDRIVLRVIPEPTTQVVEMQTGKLDMLYAIPHEHIATLREDTTLRFEREPGRNYEFITYNPDAHPAFADPEVRRALGLALNTTAMIDGLDLTGYATPAIGPYPPLWKDLQTPNAKALAYDPARAGTILDARGWIDRNGDGIREKDGRPLRFTLTTNSGNARRDGIAQIAQAQWKKIGVDARVEKLEFNTMFENLLKHRYEAAVSGWVASLSPDLGISWETGAPLNVARFHDTQTDRAIAAARTARSASEANPHWLEAADRIIAQQPYTFLFYLDTASALRDRLRNVKIDPYGSFQNTWEWWLAPN